MSVLLGSAAVQSRDSAVIANSGSTNTTGFTISIWSDGSGTVSVPGNPDRSVQFKKDLADRFFTDLRAASSDTGITTHCMKSASFGTRTVVRWHGWTSPDLQCPPFSGGVQALATDAMQIQQAANVRFGTLKRIRLPGDTRMIPAPTPEVTPT
jgi:hypothetical protein